MADSGKSPLDVSGEINIGPFKLTLRPQQQRSTPVAEIDRLRTQRRLHQEELEKIEKIIKDMEGS